MKKKRSVGITILSIYMFAAGILSVFLKINVPEISSKITIILFALCSIICGIALFRSANWGRKSAVIYFSCWIIYGCLYYSPVFHKQRVQRYKNRYKMEVSKDYSTIIFNDKEISKADFLVIQEEKIEEERRKKFNFPQMFLGMIFPGILIFYLCRSKVKEQF